MARNSEIDIVKKGHQRDRYNKNREDELLKCADDPLYFIENYVKIQHPIKGRVPFIPYDFQRGIISTYANYGRVVVLTGRQSGKTTTASAFILWKAMFTPDCTILIVANKMNQALEIMDRIRFMYENMEEFNWLRAGSVEYNKGTIKFDNGSKIVARATTADAGRGLSISLLFVDEFAFISPRLQSEFWSAIQPTLATGGDCIVTSTPNNDEDQFAQLWFGAIDTFDEFGEERSDGVGRNGFRSFKSTWRDLPDRDDAWAERERQILGVDKFKREYEGEFISADETLINNLTLNVLSGVEEEFKIGDVRWYQDVKPNQVYVVALDPSLGTGGDNAAIQVFEMPSLVQVAEWKHNTTPIKKQIQILLNILQYIQFTQENDPRQDFEPEIYWTVENNTLGEAALVVIEDTGEENFPGMFMHEPKRAGMKRVRKGFNTNRHTKLAACSRIKSFIESRRMTLKSKALIKELKNYVSSGHSFAAKWGETDDLVSATLMCVRLMDMAAQWDPELGDHIKDSIDLNDDTDMVDDSAPMPIIF